MPALVLPPELARMLFLGIVFLGVALAAMMLAQWSTSRLAVRRRLASGEERPTIRAEATLREGADRGGWVGLVNMIERAGVSLVDSRSAELRTKLLAAGFRSPAAPRLFTLIRLVLTLGLPAMLLMLMLWKGSSISLFKLYLFGSLLALFGLYAPNLFVASRAARRRAEIVRGFPDALDLMLVCVEAGLALDAAFGRVGTEMTRSHPLLAELIATLVLELRAGMSREEALRRMADRAGVDEIRAFATLLIQSDKLGSSIGQTLRIYASEMREKRKLRAEEKAHRLPVLLSVPLVACMLPTMIGVLMLPAAIRVVRVLVPALTRGH